MVRRHVAAGFAVEVQLADFQRVFADGVGDFLDHAFGGDHALRAAEAPEGGVGDGVGLQRQGLRVDRLVEIGVVAVEQRAVGDRAGEVGGEAAAGGEQEIDALDAAFVVEADDVIDLEVVALAGDDHVVVAVGAQLGGAAGLLRDEGRRGGEQVRLGFLAAEGSAHAPDFDGDGVGGDVQHVGYDVLDLAGVLGRGMDEHFVVLAGDRHGDLAFEVEVVLAADGDPAFQTAGSGGDGLGGVAALQRHGREHDFAGFPSFGRGQDGVEVFVFRHGEAGGAAGLVAGFGGDGEQGLAGVFDHVVGEQRFVVPAHAADVVGAGHVG